MSDFVYTTVPGKIKPLLEKLRHVGVPSKATVQWLKSIGYKSSNDTTLLTILKRVGMTDGSGSPTSVWSQFRGANHKQVLAGAIKKGYAQLFSVYPNAWQTPTTDLEHVVSTSSSAGKQVIQKTVATFKALCECADFAGSHEPSVTDTPPEAPRQRDPVHKQDKATDGENDSAKPSIHIDIQIHISPESSNDQIDKIFSSMAKHLYGKKNP